MANRTFHICSNCGQAAPLGDRFCPRCGAAFAGTIAGTASDAVPAPVSPDSESPWDEVVERLRKATLGEFDIVRELGRGGMAAVYLAQDIALNRRVAIKVMAPGLLMGVGMVERFRQEAVTVANLSHPNIVTIHAVRQAAGLHFFVMRLIAGQSLERVVANRGPLPVPVVQAILFQVGSALAYAHRRGIVHRDVKPANILFDEDGSAIVTDFGISRVMEAPSNTQSGMTIGTPTYMSPEQCWSREVTDASDQYSLGIVAYEMLAGRPPFQGPTLAILRSHTEDAPPPLEEVRPDVPAAMTEAIARMLAKHPEDRFPDILQAVTELGGRRPSEGDSIGDWLSQLGPPAMEVEPGQPLRTVAPAPQPSASVTGGGPVWAGTRAPDSVEVRPAASDRAPPTRDAKGRTGVLGWIADRLSQFVSARPAPEARAAELGTTKEQPIRPAREVNEASTQPFRPPDWAAAAAPDIDRTPRLDASTQLFGAPGPESGEPLFPVALSVTSSPDPGQVGTRLRCDHFPFTVGRAAASDLCVPHDSALSRAHCQIDRDESGFLIRDLSTNGLFVNGRHLQGRAEPIPFGAHIVLSKVTAVTFVADIPMLPPLEGELIGGRYELGELVHQSIKAATYIARDRRLPHRVAVKLFSPSLRRLASYRDEFERQATLAASLQHPHICHVLDFGETVLVVGARSQLVSFLCTACMTGGNLQSRLESHPPELALAGRWIQKLADALDYAHHHQVIHGDLKPSCIVFDGDGTPYLTDFALARGGDAPTRSVLGTPDYLAPEQWDGESPTAATDQYSLAVLAYIMITGTRPHEGQSDPAVRARNFRRGPPLAHEEALVYGRKAISQRVSRVLAQAMSVRSADRYPSVGEFSAALAEAIANPDRRSAEPHIFMSYHRESSAGWANLLAQSLKEKYGYSVFIDTQAQDGAPQIPERLRTEIAQCDVFVCMLAPATLTSRWVREEIDVAFQFHKPMVPVFHEDFRPKDQTEGGESGVKSLLNFAAVHLLDRKNIHVEHTITELAERVRKALP